MHFETNAAPCGRAGHSCTLSGDFMFLFGGNNSNETFNDFWKIELPMCHFWEKIETNVVLGPRIGHQIVTFGKDFFLLGGRSKHSRKFITDVSVFNCQKNTFVKIEKDWAKLWEKKTGHSAVLWDRKIFIFGGLVEKKNSKNGMLLLDMTEWGNEK
mmetsp:Transcript_4287/g.6533  ORF Transcript_4287/g.6533 Transcript_4287/m.6533 type:complete len:156 (+) Transcript_4287:759-1226(+)